MGGIEADQIQRSEDRRTGPPQSLADDGIQLVDPQILFHHDADGVGDVERTDAVADEIGDILADDDPLPQDLLAEPGHVSHDFGFRLFPGMISSSFI